MLFCSASRSFSRSSVSPSSGAKARHWLATVAVAARAVVIRAVVVAAATLAAAAKAVATIVGIIAVAAVASNNAASRPAAVLSRAVLRLARRPAVALRLARRRAVVLAPRWAAKATWVVVKLAVPRPLPKLPRRLPRPSSSVVVPVWSASVVN